MRTVRSATEDEVIAAFLHAEIDSERHDQRTLKELQSDGRPRSVVDAPDFQDAGANAYRRSLLGRVRGWGRGEGMFQGFPEHVDWELVALTPEELAEVRYIGVGLVAGALWGHQAGHGERQADPCGRVPR